ncbi:hypothetical protein LJC36_00150 [Desulfovibrio sp. OttesenSCG-928-C14]|nr:hypothetical protein [Desulfovibrio sp. OttesenSCG-928-C14]
MITKEQIQKAKSLINDAKSIISEGTKDDLGTVTNLTIIEESLDYLIPSEGELTPAEIHKMWDKLVEFEHGEQGAFKFDQFGALIQLSAYKNYRHIFGWDVFEYKGELYITYWRNRPGCDKTYRYVSEIHENMPKP